MYDYKDNGFPRMGHNQHAGSLIYRMMGWELTEDYGYSGEEIDALDIEQRTTLLISLHQIAKRVERRANADAATLDLLSGSVFIGESAA